jgi:hypothetical protein
MLILLSSVQREWVRDAQNPAPFFMQPVPRAGGETHYSTFPTKFEPSPLEAGVSTLLIDPQLLATEVARAPQLLESARLYNDNMQNHKYVKGQETDHQKSNICDISAIPKDTRRKIISGRVC